MTEPGWYPDQSDPAMVRYWDGARWGDPVPAAEQSTPSAPIAPSPPTCAVAPCPEPRMPGNQFCSRHARGTLGQPGTGQPVAVGTSGPVCPHCQVQGRVRRRSVKQKKGVSGAKLTGAIFTAGISMLGTGLSRKERHTEMRCGNCGTVWYV